MKPRDWLLFSALGVVWGSSFLWIKIAVQEVGPFTLVAFRVLFATLGLVAVAWVTRPAWPKDRSVWKIFLVLGLCNVALPFLLISWSEKTIDSSMASILNSTVPLFTILIAPLFVKDDRFTLPKLAGLLVGFAGVVVLLSGDLRLGAGQNLTGQMTMLLASCLYSGSAVYARRKTTGLSANFQSLAQLAMATIFMGIVAPIAEAPFTLPRLPLTWLALIWLGLIGSCLGTLLYFALLNSVGPTRTTLTSYIFPLVGVVLGIVFLKERPDWHFAVGALLILSGIAVVNWKKRGI